MFTADPTLPCLLQESEAVIVFLEAEWQERDSLEANTECELYTPVQTHRVGNSQRGIEWEGKESVSKKSKAEQEVEEGESATS